jgi:transposase, IS30 family
MEQRTYSQLSLKERIEIYHWHANGISLRNIGLRLGRAASTISRELKRNMPPWQKGVKVVYDPEVAHQRYVRRHARGRRHKLERQPSLRARVLNLLAMEWSPEQIAGRLALEEGRTVISAESIYRFIYWRAYHFRGEHWHKYLVSQRRTRRCRLVYKKRRQPPIIGRRPLSERPTVANNRTQTGHWEADLMHFSNSGQLIKQAVLVLYDRSSRYTCLALQPTKQAADVLTNLHKLFDVMPAHKRHSVTFDNGQEFSRHLELTQTKAIETFFCEPHSPWQKGGVENTIKRLRRYLPRKTTPETLNKETLANIMHNFNNTPRKILGFKTPAEVFFNQTVALQT